MKGFVFIAAVWLMLLQSAAVRCKAVDRQINVGYSLESSDNYHYSVLVIKDGHPAQSGVYEAIDPNTGGYQKVEYVYDGNRTHVKVIAENLKPDAALVDKFGDSGDDDKIVKEINENLLKSLLGSG